MTVKTGVQVLVQGQEAVRHARLFLEDLQTSMLGAFVSPPPGSKWAVLLEELRVAEATLQNEMVRSVEGK